MNLTELKKQALSDKDLRKLVPEANILTYKELKNYKSINDAMGPNGKLFLLVETKPNYGHWTAIYRRNKDTIAHFDSYGLEPDDELMFVPMQLEKQLGESFPYLSKLLYESPYKFIEYNPYKLQESKKDINTCGRWVALRLMNQELGDGEFYDEIKKLRKGKYSSDDIVALLTSQV